MDETRYRTAEAALWAHVGGAPRDLVAVLPRTGTKVRLQELGEGPAVLFVHGATNGGTSWAHLATRLPGHRCLLLDRPGCGLSEPIGRNLLDPADLARFADGLVAEVLDALDLPSAAVVGTSFGGYFALRAAAAHPERVERLFGLSWPFGAPIAKVPFSMRMAGVRPIGKLMGRVPPPKAAVTGLLKQIGLRHALEHGVFDDVCIAWFQSVLRDTDTRRNELDGAPPVVRPLAGLDQRLLLGDDLLGRIRCPVHFLWGVDDPQGGAAVAEPFVARIPGATLEMMDPAGHAPWMDDPDHVAASLRAFLAC